ncbi:putative Cysteine-rich domain [Monocercomonoides exilis]|uniref:putative Cysteine-rich domain n=1 Tax=Monocercomonoides exilis TaxID=2049356 RepID=UPI003559DA89|nr:putative Cysteine-rich domain [Monocercomonoides exilis]
MEPDVKAPNIKLERRKIFSCCICKLNFPYDSYGPKCHTSTMAFLEDAYMIIDPFTTCSHSICVGGKCASCFRAVCADSKCSLFFSKRFCAECCRKNCDMFPEILLGEIRQMRH